MSTAQKGSPRYHFGEAGMVHIPIVIVFLLAVGLVVVGNVQTSTQYDEGDIQGVLIAKGGEDEDKSGSGNSGSSDKSEDREESRDDNSNKGSSQENRIRQEVRTSDERIKTEIREDRTRVDVYQGDTKTKIQQKDDEIVIKTEIEEDEEEDEATESGEESELVQELRAISKFPLRIDTNTNQLIMVKGGVERVLTVLPAQAVQNMLRAHLKKGLGPKFFQDATPSATPAASPSASPEATPTATVEPTPSSAEATESAEVTVLESQIELEERAGRAVYHIPALKHLKVLGLIPVTTQFTAYVSAETGNLLEEQQSLLSRILDLLSP